MHQGKNPIYLLVRKLYNSAFSDMQSVLCIRAIALNILSEEDFNKYVCPEDMIAPKV